MIRPAAGPHSGSFRVPCCGKRRKLIPTRPGNGILICEECDVPTTLGGLGQIGTVAERFIVLPHDIREMVP